MIQRIEYDDGDGILQEELDVAHLNMEEVNEMMERKLPSYNEFRTNVSVVILGVILFIILIAILSVMFGLG